MQRLVRLFAILARADDRAVGDFLAFLAITVRRDTVCRTVCRSAGLSVCLSVGLSVCLPRRRGRRRRRRRRPPRHGCRRLRRRRLRLGLSARGLADRPSICRRGQMEGAPGAALPH